MPSVASAAFGIEADSFAVNAQKTRLAEAITKDVMEVLHYGDESVSVAMEEVEPQDWLKKVYKPDIKHNWDKVYKKPGYDESDL